MMSILQGKFIVVMTSAGKIFSQPLVPSVTANDGPVYFTVSLVTNHRSIKEGGDALVNGGGASIYYSHTLQMLFFSYFNGTQPLVNVVLCFFFINVESLKLCLVDICCLNVRTINIEIFQL